MKLRDEQKKRRKQNIYPHRMSRKGYARFADEIADELCDDDDINRAIMWKKGRVNKKGQYEGDELKSAIEKIDGYVQQKIEGTLQYEEGKNDILTKALDSYEHSGRVRGVGGHITPSIYFYIGRVWKSPFGDDHIFLNQTKELMEAKILISKQDARIAEQNARISDQDARIQRLEEMFKKGASNFDIEEKGSFSVKLHPMSDDKIKKGASNYATSHDDDVKTLSNAEFLQGKPVVLALESRTNIVAYGTIVHVNADDKLFHGVPSPITCMHVSIDNDVDKLAHLPFPIPNECDTVGDAVGTHVAWPAHFVVIQDEKLQKKKNVDHRNKIGLSSSVPRSLRLLYCYCKRALTDEQNLSLLFDHDLFDESYELLLHLEKSVLSIVWIQYLPIV
ncbi:uncharacterized protein LOC142521947 [Primulina tabacum]|uniref:uncharacterized protein LOC142521947 n=1 Tax=Primulina tabacum TaxID=48773 RepID=UPI003F59D7E9